MITLDRVYKASRVLKEIIRETDMIYAPNIRKGTNVYLKTENLQVTGSFKIRGSYFKISQLTDEEKAHGVIAASAGNHAQGVALAATKSGIKSLICLPAGAPISKVEATKRFGAEVCMVEGVFDDAYNKALELRDEKGYCFIHPFNDPDVIAKKKRGILYCVTVTHWSEANGFKPWKYLFIPANQIFSNSTFMMIAKKFVVKD